MSATEADDGTAGGALPSVDRLLGARLAFGRCFSATFG